MKTMTTNLVKCILIVFFALVNLAAFSQEYVSNVNVLNGRKQYRYSDTFTDYEVQAKGTIKVNDDDTRIVSISPGGYLKISKKTFGNKRTLIIESSSGGDLRYEYYEGRTEVPYEPEGKKWLADILLDVVRITGIDAEGRTRRIYTKKGINGFLEEVREISSNSISGLYFEELLDNFKLNEEELSGVCKAIAGEISSNSERGRLYRKYSKLFLSTNVLAVNFFESVAELSSNSEQGSVLRSIDQKIDFNDPRVTEAYFTGVDKLSSNSEAGSVLRDVEKSQSLSRDAYIRLLISVQKLSSNTESGSVMRSLRNLEMADPGVADAWFNALDAMTSNTEAGSTMRDLIGRNPLDDNTTIRLLASIKKLSSNTEAGSVLRSINKINFGNPQVSAAYFTTISAMTSNTEQGSVLRNALGKYSMTEESWDGLFRTVGTMSSSTEMGSVMRNAVDSMPFEKEILDAFFASCNKITSNVERGRVLRAVAANPGMNKTAALGIINSSKILSSNTEKSSVLRSVAKTPYIKDEEVKKEYMAAARTLSSDTEYRLVVDAILEN